MCGVVGRKNGLSISLFVSTHDYSISFCFTIYSYHNVVCASLDFVCDAPVAVGDNPIPTDARLAFFNETRHSYGRTALLLSGGAALGFYHVGVVKALIENRLMPRVIGGSSAGSIVCAMIGTRTDEECLNDMFEMKGTVAPGHSGRMVTSFFRPLHLPLADPSFVPQGIGEVYKNTAGFLHDVKRTWQILVPIQLRNFTSVMYDLLTLKTRPQELLMSDTEHFRECLRINVGDFTFQEAFDRTGRILNITVTPNNASDPPRLLNYLTAPHVLVWSAAVASSSLPGVFEANRLMVKDADGNVRYESAESARFSDGSMEQDLPMQQLSEMFNVNHFVISQANPHAVLVSLLCYVRRFWDLYSSYFSPLYVLSVFFLFKFQVGLEQPADGLWKCCLKFFERSMSVLVTHFVELVGARRLAPQHATARFMGAQFFVQEYEGRDCDVSLVPWINHRGVFSALMHALYNPSEEEFREWVEAAQRETWRHIPAIKSHVAEEITLDRCVQRLRKRIVVESWEKRHKVDSTSAKMGDRVPSFFASPSLVNFGGLGVADPATVDSHLETLSSSKKDLKHLNSHTPTIPPVDISQGWNGMGLRGNRSNPNFNLERSSSDASGLFIDGDDQNLEQVAGEQTNHLPTISVAKKVPSVNSTASSTDEANGYIKTTNMANFYYRNFPTTHGSLDRMPRTHSQGEKMEESKNHRRRKSKSHAELRSVFPTPTAEELSRLG